HTSLVSDWSSDVCSSDLPCGPLPGFSGSGLSRGLIEEISQGRHRAVMQVRRSRPQAIQRHVHVAIRLAKVVEPPPVPGTKRVLIDRQVFGKGIEPIAVGADLVDGHNLAEVRAFPVMTGGAVSLVNRSATGSQDLVDREWVFGDW